MRSGLTAKQVGRMAGVELPVSPMQHHYLVTETIPEIAALDFEVPMMIDLEGYTYMRQELQGVLVGVYERDYRHWNMDGAPWDYGLELIPPDVDRISSELSFAMSRYPVLEHTGISRWVNGAFTFSPDGNPLVGPVPGLRNYWSACAVMAGFLQGGGVGKSLAEWMIEGELLDVAGDGSLIPDEALAEAAGSSTSAIEKHRARLRAVFEISADRGKTPGRPMYRYRRREWDESRGVAYLPARVLTDPEFTVTDVAVLVGTGVLVGLPGPHQPGRITASGRPPSPGQPPQRAHHLPQAPGARPTGGRPAPGRAAPTSPRRTPVPTAAKTCRQPPTGHAAAARRPPHRSQRGTYLPLNSVSPRRLKEPSSNPPLPGAQQRAQQKQRRKEGGSAATTTQTCPGVRSRV